MVANKTDRENLNLSWQNRYDCFASERGRRSGRVAVAVAVDKVASDEVSWKRTHEE